MPDAWPEATGDRLRSYDASHPVSRHALEAVWNWMGHAHHGGAPGLILWSKNYGVGKTHLALAADDTLRAAGHRGGTFINAVDFYGSIRDRYSRYEPEFPLFNMWACGDYFILDDLGSEYSRDESREWYQEKIYRLLDRLCERKPFLMTSNLSLEMIAERVGGKAWSRLAGMCGKSGSVDMSSLPDRRLKG